MPGEAGVAMAVPIAPASPAAVPAAAMPVAATAVPATATMPVAATVVPVAATPAAVTAMRLGHDGGGQGRADCKSDGCPDGSAADAAACRTEDGSQTCLNGAHHVHHGIL
jgi:hypothetical protein